MPINFIHFNTIRFTMYGIQIRVAGVGRLITKIILLQMLMAKITRSCKAEHYEIIMRLHNLYDHHSIASVQREIKVY